MCFGGRVAEEIVFGPEKVTTGAGSDIEQATALARRMVTQFGMSEQVGLIAVGDKEQEIFLGREFAQRREISERTAEMVDDEVKRLLDEAFAEAADDPRRRTASCSTASRWRCSSARRIDREDLDRLLKGELLPPASAGRRAAAGAAPRRRPSRPRSPARAPILGAPPAEPAGA